MSDGSSERPETANPNAAVYRVLARKYRPSRFADLIGQEAMVRTVSNAIERGRVAHAFILTGVRGVGKTTTARIIARALNCVGPDGGGGPTPEPCGSCEHCVSIAEDRHVDVIEMDAASRTGIDDVRELIEGVRYRPVSARNKVYIIDEVHMLSRQAFNGLLKTLEEPPDHVIFVFATTEIRKVPVTVLSRCQRFDLRRVTQEELVRHFGGIAEKESIEAGETALAMIARAADGSVRDGLSLLDQAIALSAGGNDGTPVLREEQIQAMLGLADRTRVYDLFEAVMRGRVAEALDLLTLLYRGGADPAAVLRDLLELTHGLTRIKLVPRSADDPAAPELERVRGKALAEKLSVPVLSRAWQMLLKGLGETRDAPAPLQAAEMVVVRLAHASDLPSPADLVAALQDGKGAAGAGAAPLSAGPSAGAPASGPAAALRDAPRDSDPRPAGRPAARGPDGAATARALDAPPAPGPALDPAPNPALDPGPDPEPALLPAAAAPDSWRAVVALVRGRREVALANRLERDLHLVRFEPGRIEVRPGPDAPRNIVGRLSEVLSEWTGMRWVVSVSSAPGEPPLREVLRTEEQERRDAVLRDPLVKAVMETFPGAQLVDRRDKSGS